MNNSIYGKTIEKLRKKLKVRLFDNVRDCKKYVTKPSFFSQEISSIVNEAIRGVSDSYFFL